VSLVSILSAEPLPLMPPKADEDVEKYIRDLHTYLRRQWSHVSGEAMADSIAEDSPSTSNLAGISVNKWIRVTGNGTVVVSDKNWSGRNIHMFYQWQKDDKATVKAALNGYASDASFFIGDGFVTPTDLQTGSAGAYGDYALQYNADGTLSFESTNFFAEYQYFLWMWSGPRIVTEDLLI